MPSVLKAGSASGRAMRRKSCDSLAPSSRAASKYSRGSVSKKVRIRYMPNGICTAAQGSTTACTVLVQSRSLICTNIGITSRMPGSMISSSIAMKMKSLPGKL